MGPKYDKSCVGDELVHFLKGNTQGDFNLSCPVTKKKIICTISLNPKSDLDPK